MSGYSNAGSDRPTDTQHHLIVLSKNNNFTIDYHIFDWGVEKEVLVAWSEQVLEVFGELRRKINQNVRKNKVAGIPLEKSLILPKEFCHQQLQRLAKWGTLAYREFFSDEARRLLENRFKMDQPNVPAPTFVSKLTPFPWEVLYEGEDVQGELDMFWGFAYAPARILDRKDVYDYVRERNGPSNMLFCLHHKLHEAHQKEWPRIKKLVKVTKKDQVYLLGATDMLVQVEDGESLLGHLYQSQHNMVHFACHAVQCQAGKDALLFSLINQADLGHLNQRELEVDVIELNTHTFTFKRGRLISQPLVFLNACHSAGGGDDLRISYNLPRKFVACDAGAVIATACPVPDVFAAEFARIFYSFFLRGTDSITDWQKRPTHSMSIGEALRRTRLYFVEKHNNPLGLAYGLYTPAHYRVASPPMRGGLF